MRADPRLIGAFVLGALVLFVLLVVAIGGGRLFSSRQIYVLHFRESVKGLRHGATVAFRGVPVGRVVSVEAELDTDQEAVRVPVRIEIERDQLRLGNGRSDLTSLVPLGLRAQLRLESLLTGQLYVALDLFPNAPPPPPSRKTELPEIPTIPSPYSKVSRSLEEATAALPRTLERAVSVLERLEGLLDEPNLRAIRTMISNGAALSVRLKELGARLPDLASRTERLLGDTDRLTNLLSRRIAARDDQLRELLSDFGRTSGKIAAMAGEIRALVRENRRAIRDFTATGLPLFTGFLEDATRAANELQGLLRDIRNDPRSFFLGTQRLPEVQP